MARRISRIEAEIKRRCLAEGLTKQGCYYLKPMADPSFYGFLFFIITKHPHHLVKIDVHVGIYSVKTERLYNLLTQTRAKSKYPMWVYNGNIGYVEPGRSYREWEFHEDADIGELCSEMFREIREYAYPFFERASNFETLTQMYREGFPPIIKSMRYCVLPLFYAMAGEVEKGRLVMEEMEREGYLVDGYNEVFYEAYCTRIRAFVPGQGKQERYTPARDVEQAPQTLACQRRPACVL